MNHRNRPRMGPTKGANTAPYIFSAQIERRNDL